jgi:ribosomal protein L11 methyltransferase
MNPPTTVARLACDESTARRLASFLGETLDSEDAVCAAFEGDDGRWQLAVHFRAVPDDAGLRELVGIAAGEAAARALNFERVAGADWVAQSLAGLKPVRAGRFVIHGAHDRAQPKPNDIAIEIEAALAFGTGHHGTTLGCLLALTDLAKRRHFRRVLDIGTGTGVLAIATARLLHTRVVAGDIDPVAVRAAKSNARLNRAAPLIAFARAAGTVAPAIARAAPYDLILANILLGPIARMAVPLRKLVVPDARIVLSGLLPGHVNAVLAIYRAQGLMLERRIQREGWATLVLRRAPKQNRPGRERPGRLFWRETWS